MAVTCSSNPLMQTYENANVLIDVAVRVCYDRGKQDSSNSLVSPCSVGRETGKREIDQRKRGQVSLATGLALELLEIGSIAPSLSYSTTRLSAVRCGCLLDRSEISGSCSYLRIMFSSFL